MRPVPASPLPWTRLIRFLTRSGSEHFGDALLPAGVHDISLATRAAVISGDPLSPTCTVTPQIVDVHRLLPPLPPSQTRTVRCLGLNYAAHAKESNMALPTYPVLFYKPQTALSGPGAALSVPRVAQESDGLDYECELVVVIGTDARDVPEERALDYVLGYAVGNDVSQRHLQLAVGGGQWSHGKGFDGWAPWGPGIVRRDALGDGTGAGLRIGTTVNGERRQGSSTGDMVFGVARTVALLSRGTTLQRGDLIFTGTPQGVGMGMTPKGWLREGDEVVVELEGVGSVKNKVVFEGVGEAKL
ncbi:Fumarylacetoacetase-like protein [Geopyxis carbonaria]|nr:Fumarylacetoacetase-like protein [Geopyxis carbonaria]